MNENLKKEYLYRIIEAITFEDQISLLEQFATEYTKEQQDIDPEKVDEIIRSIPVNQANFEFIAKSGRINGSLLFYLRNTISAIVKGKKGFKVIT